jgi:hypothetical protein
MLALMPLGGCWWYGPFEDPSAQYIHRTQTIATEAGNAQEVNAATQVIDPWPPSAANRNIPANGDRMVNTAERYRAKAGPAGPGGQQGGLSPIAGAGTVSSGSAPSNNPPLPPN